VNTRRDLARIAPGVELITSYPKDLFRPDVLAALSLWAIVVPQGLAYGQLAGLGAVTGLYTALGGMLLYAIFGGSKQLTVGPESSVAIVVGTFVANAAAGDPERAIAIAGVLALLTAGFLLVGAVLRLGKIVRLLSSPILTGYLAGAAIIIIASQTPKLFDVTVTGTEWWQKLLETARQLDEANPYSVVIGAAVLVGTLALRRWAPKLPSYLVTLALATVAVAALGLDEGPDAVSVVGTVKAGVPIPSLPALPLGTWIELLLPAASIALLVYASSVATALALATRRKEEIDPNQEFIGLASACIGAGLLGGFPANASDSRSFVVADSGGRSQMVNFLGAGMVLVTLAALTPLFRSLPSAALGAVVIVSAAQLINVKAFRRLYGIRRSDFVLALLTFAGVLAFDVLPGIVFGVFVSLLEVLRRAAFPSTAILGAMSGRQTYRDIGNYDEAQAEPGLVVYRFDAPLFFANADVFKEDIRGAVEHAPEPVRMVIVNAEGITDLDVTGAEMLSSLLDWLNDRDVSVSFARVRTALRDTMRAQGFEDRLGPEQFHLRVLDAVEAFHRRDA
jgi:SulP family sulfate permease